MSTPATLPVNTQIDISATSQKLQDQKPLDWPAWIQAASAVVTGIFTLALVWVGFRQSQISWEQAAISKKQIATLERLEKPLLLVVPPLGAIEYKDSGDQSEFPEFNINFINYGRSPAIIECWHIAVIISDKPPARELIDDGFFRTLAWGIGYKENGVGFKLTYYLKVLPHDAVVGINAELGWSIIKPTPLRPNQAEAIKNESTTAWVDGIVIYTDVFNVRHETNFRWRYEPVTDLFITDGGAEFNSYT